MGRIFGTDGARGVANTELSCTLAMDIGRAAEMVVAREHHKRQPVFLFAHDTRISHDMLESAIRRTHLTPYDPDGSEADYD